MHRIAILILLLVAAPVSAQKFQIGKVSVKELEEKVHPKDSSARGAVLYNKARTYLYFNAKSNTFSAVHEFELRIKIYKKEGLSLANYEIPYYVGFKNLNPEMLDVKEAATYNLVNGKVEKTKVGGTGTFKEKVNENWKTATIVFPDVKVGSIVEFKYILKSENIHTFPSFMMQRDIPVNYAEYKTEIPVNYIYKTLLNGFLPISKEQKVESSSQSFTDEYGHMSSLNFQQLASIYSATDIPPLQGEEYIDNLNNYRLAIEHELEMIKFPNVPDKNLAQTWDGVVKTIYNDDDFGKQLKDSKFLEADVRRIIEGSGASQQQRMEAVLKYVQTKMNWNGRYGIFTSGGVKKAWQESTGNASEINMLLIMMLNLSGVLTDPVLVSTVQNGIAAFPNTSAFNYVVAGAQIGEKRILLDAVNKNTVPGILPAYALNWSGRLVASNGESEEIPLAPSILSKEIFTVMGEIGTDGIIKGKGRIHKTDYKALAFREQYKGGNRESYLEGFEKRLHGIQISNYSRVGESVLAEPVIESFDFSTDNEVELLAGKMYINPLLFFTMYNNPFVKETRSLPIYFGYPQQNKYVLSLTLPEGYTVESLPQPIYIATGEDVGSFKFSTSFAQNSLTVTVTYEMSRMLVAADFYVVIREFFSKMVAKENEKIVLKKI